MPHRQGYDLSNLCKKSRQYGRGPTEQKDSPLDTTLVINNTQGNGESNYAMATQSQIPHSQHEQHEQQSRLSPGYTRSSGEYTLYNEHTGRGWKRIIQATNSTRALAITSPSTSNTAINTNDNNISSDPTDLSPSKGGRIRNRGIRKLKKRVTSITQRAIQASQNARRFLTPPFSHRSTNPLPSTLMVSPAETATLKHTTCGQQLDQTFINTQPPLLLPQIIVTSPSGEEKGVQ
ncbi:hypothetical protein F4813DRAFT_213378 [Daldinia decipiens]|uniref:uncharacterized protein n=1 Tax=Daldinia decipiens TaxID=326647 RepID=UPI0020C4A824|nr:uncharacterized protein F4813DRAFT_213378 [Daldinia decipiens]KAI1654325.1 hypothetical protein F4813DRAFT_213378 [Daldinia decipiens]